MERASNLEMISFSFNSIELYGILECVIEKLALAHKITEIWNKKEKIQSRKAQKWERTNSTNWNSIWNNVFISLYEICDPLQIDERKFSSFFSQWFLKTSL